jgi:hypothetical protein
LPVDLIQRGKYQPRKDIEHPAGKPQPDRGGDLPAAPATGVRSYPARSGRGCR